MPSSPIIRNILALELEERILNASSFVAMLTVFLPWIGGDWLGTVSSYSGFGFFTSYLGLAIFFLHLAILLLTLVPIAGGPVLVKKRQKETVRLWLCTQTVVLTLSALTVLMRASSEFTRMDVRFGIYLCLGCSMVAFFESLHRYVVSRKSLTQEVFHHPEDQPALKHEEPSIAPPPPPPPPPLDAEDHPLYPV